MTSTARKIGIVESKVTKKRVSLNSSLRQVSKGEIKARLSRNSSSGRIAEMSFSDAGLKRGEL